MAPNFSQILAALALPLYTSGIGFRALFDAAALQFQILAGSAERVVNEAFPKSARDIEALATDRGISRIAGEPLESYRLRVQNAYVFQKRSSTLEGISFLITKVTAKRFAIRELYRENWILGASDEALGIETLIGSPLDRFFFIVEFFEELLDKEKKYIEHTLQLYKPAHVGFRIIINPLIWEADGE